MFESRDDLRESLKVKCVQVDELIRERDILRAELGKIAKDNETNKTNAAYYEKEFKRVSESSQARDYQTYAKVMKYEELVKSIRDDLRLARETVALKNEYIRAIVDLEGVRLDLEKVKKDAAAVKKELGEMREKAATERL